MPVVELDVKRLCKLIGRNIDSSELSDAITRMGADVEGVDEKTISVEFFPDRPDLLSTEGTARALRSFLNLKPGLKKYVINPSRIEVRVDASVLPIRGVIECLNVRNVELDDELLKELMELQEDLHWALGRDRKKVAIGVHDSSMIKPPYIYQASRPGEIRFEPLGMPGKVLSLAQILKEHPKGIEYAHIVNKHSKYPIILDSNGNVLSMPPIINGELTKLSEDTTRIFVDMTGTDKKAVSKAMNILASAFAENGWTLESVHVNYPDQKRLTPDLKPHRRRLSIDYTNKILGLRLSPEEVGDCLRRMGYDAVTRQGFLEVDVPAYRPDILHDIDLVEDVSIAYGYMRFTPELPALFATGSILLEEGQDEKARQALLGLGFTEAVTLMLTNERSNNQRMGIKEKAVRVQNPISEDHTIIRTHLIPRLLEVLYINRHRELPQRIFELGDVLRLDSKLETGARREKRLAACSIHHKANFSEAKSVFNSLLRDLDINGKAKALDHPSFIPGRCAGISGTGYFGELHPAVLSSFDLEYPAIAMEFKLK